MQKSFDEFLSSDFFTAVEYHPDCVKDNNTLLLLNEDGSSKKRGERKPGIGLQAAAMGAVPGHSFVKEAMSWYEKNHFILPDGSLNNVYIAPDVLSAVAENYGFKYKNEEQKLKDNMLILPSDIIAGDLEYDVNERTVAVHYTLNSWKPAGKNPLKKIKSKLGKIQFLRRLLGK